MGGTLVQQSDGQAEVPGVFGRHRVKPVPGTSYAEVASEETSVPDPRDAQRAGGASRSVIRAASSARRSGSAR
ncbi:hypothetical protein [Streptomyces sp. NPDC050287]|uniref:hypothetical protein n=1 Tax=Streptomyces sp. NPDC050287 TaxID=3365608 RepID=UPI0037B39FA0